MSNNDLAPGGVTYDANGRLSYDGSNNYLYEAQGWLCGVETAAGGIYQYYYDASGNMTTYASRSNFTCYTGTTTISDFLYDQAGRQITAVDISGKWLYTNVFASGELLASYNNADQKPHYALSDWLGDKRVQLSPTGPGTAGSPNLSLEENCWNLPFNDGFGCSGSTGTDTSNLHYTGKPHDSNTGLDLFGARDYTNFSGRFLSPDWSRTPTAVPYALLNNPQSLNLYAYAGNNPLSRTDPDGHFWEQLKNLFGDAGCWCNAAQAATAIQNLRNDLQTWQAKFDGKTPDYQNLTPRQARSYHDQFTTAADAFDQQQKEQAGQLPFLRFLHGSDTRSNIDSIRKMSTEDIIESLKPGNAESLKVKMNGTVMNGNTRLRVLEERGVDIENLPRDIHTSEPVGPSLGEEIEGIGEDPLP